MSNQTSTVVIPTNPADLKDIKNRVREGADSLLRIDAEKALIKDIIDAIVEDYELPKQYVSDLVRREHKGDFEEKATKFDDFTALYEAVKSA